MRLRAMPRGQTRVTITSGVIEIGSPPPNTGGMTTTRDLHAFDEDTRVQRQSEGHFTATVSDRWDALGGVINGGYYVALCLRALRETLAHPDPVVVSTFFLRAGGHGPVDIATEVARDGRRMSTGQVRLMQDGKELVRTTATFADLVEAQDNPVMLGTPPDLPEPDDAIDPVGTPIPGVTMTDQVEFRYAAIPGWRSGQPSGDPTSAFWMRFTGDRDADTLSLPLLVDAAAPVVLDLGMSGSTTIELTTHVRHRPSPGWLACRVKTRYVMAGYHEEDFEIWDSRDHLVAQARQLALALRDV
jgi:acyl-CoA thioesterase